MAADPYNDLVRGCFENPIHAIAGDDDYAGWVSGAAAESENGSRVRLAARIDAGRIAEMRFSAWGCPYLIAAAEYVCGSLEGEDARTLGAVSANDLAARLSVPATRLGRLLLIEDAAASLLERTGV